MLHTPFLGNGMHIDFSSSCCLSSSFCSRVSTHSTISAAVKQTGTSVIVACGLAEHWNGKAACPHLCLCVSNVHLSSSLYLGAFECVRAYYRCAYISCLSATVCDWGLAIMRELWDLWRHAHTSWATTWLPVRTWYGENALCRLSLQQQTWMSHLYEGFSKANSHAWTMWSLTFKL